MGIDMKPIVAASASCAVCVCLFIGFVILLLVLAAIALPGECTGTFEECEAVRSWDDFPKVFNIMFFQFVGTGSYVDFAEYEEITSKTGKNALWCIGVASLLGKAWIVLWI